MTKSPPHRRGITFEVGAQLEARDSLKNWYAASIEKIDYEDEKVLIHYRQWSHRYDEWFDWSSPYLRPVERIQLRKQGLNERQSAPGFHVNQKVLASWSDCRYYPAKILSRDKDAKDVERPNGPELRKRRASTGQMPPSKRSRANSSTEKNSPSQIKPVKTEVPETSESKDDPTTPAGNAAPTEEAESAPDLAAALKRQVHLPTTNKYSREPLYRVIKNQPPPILSIELDHNLFKCKIAGCLKSFRKASLLHYHMKYYHAQSDPSPPRCVQTRTTDKQNHSQETPRRRRTVSASHNTPSPLSDSKSGHTLSPPAVGSTHRQRSATLGAERSKENQHFNRSLHDDRDWVAKETGVKERERLREKRQRDFFRIKLKKKKKKKRKSKSDCYSTEESIGLKPFPCNLNSAHKLPLSLTHRSYTGLCPEKMLSQGEDSSSDLSSDSPVWSEDESDAELDLNMPLSEQGVETVSHGSEIVRCICEVQEENDFMIQCDECLCWQHGTCMGLYEDSVPDSYSCYICRDPPAQRQSQRYWYDKDWLSSGHMYGLSFLEENYSHQNSKKVTAAHQLLGDVHRVFEVLNGLQLKMSILQAQAHPDLKLWRQPWKPVDGLRRKAAGDSGIATPFPPSPPEMGVNEFETLKSEVPSPVETHCSFQDSYISSEHCYQKPRTYYPAVERRLVVETRGGSELEDSLRSTEDLLEMAEQRYSMPLDHDQHKLQLADRSFSKELECRMKRLVSAEQEKSCVVEIKEEEPDPVTPDPKPDPDLVLHQQWQLNLLEHIEAVQDEVTHRMDLIERELDVLESWLDYTGELEPPDPLARLPQLKHRIRQLLTDLGTVQQIALCSSSS
ncbi:PHD finger protein 20b isoform X3 [Megalobrama amblycephala]|uniref:PHD finger protein 20b isoform X3 n=1 Tax=Megalobrama amblycephala TaxID=75352 RepID=UPI002013D6E3|nr:PHD finger protein 20b isoform X3 [Megalobrama amblycephala]